MDGALYPDVQNVDVYKISERKRDQKQEKENEDLVLSNKPTLVLSQITGRRSERKRKIDDGKFYMQVKHDGTRNLKSRRIRYDASDGGNSVFIQRLRIASCVKLAKGRVATKLRTLIGYNSRYGLIERMMAVSGEAQPVAGDMARTMAFSRGGYFKARLIKHLLTQLQIKPGEIMQRSEQQIELHEALLGATLPIVFGDQWAAESHRAPRILGLGTCRRDVLATAPRQFGKTTGVASFVAVFAAVIGSENVLVISNLLHQCKNMLERIIGFMEHMPILQKRVKVRMGSLCIVVRHGNGDTTENTQIFAKKDARGTSARLIVADEMAYMKYDEFAPIVPLIGVNKSAFVGMSTVHKDNRNFFNRLVRGEGFKFHVIEILSGICSKCKREDPSLTKCIHGLINRPKWKSSSREEKVKKILAGDKNTFMVETMGVMTDQTEYAFRKKSIDKLLDVGLSFRDISQVTIPRIFVAVDPTGGGDSEMGICSMALLPGGKSNQFIVRFFHMMSRQPPAQVSHCELNCHPDIVHRINQKAFVGTTYHKLHKPVHERPIRAVSVYVPQVARVGWYEQLDVNH